MESCLKNLYSFENPDLWSLCPTNCLCHQYDFDDRKCPTSRVVHRHCLEWVTQGPPTTPPTTTTSSTQWPSTATTTTTNTITKIWRTTKKALSTPPASVNLPTNPATTTEPTVKFFLVTCMLKILERFNLGSWIFTILLILI